MLNRLLTFVTDRIFLYDLSKMEGKNMTYRLMKRIIEKGGVDPEATLLKLDVFLMADRITPEEYQELVEMMGGEQ